MKNLRGLFQALIIILIGVINVLILLHFSIDFFGYTRQQPIVNLLYALSSILLSPFNGIFESMSADTTIVNYAAGIGFVVYIVSGIIMLKIINTLFSDLKGQRVRKFINIFFLALEVIFSFKLSLTFLNALDCFFLRLITSITNVFTFPFQLLIPAEYKEQITEEIQIISVIIVVGLFWYILLKLYKGILEESTEEPYSYAATPKPAEKKPIEKVPTVEERETVTKPKKDIIRGIIGKIKKFIGDLFQFEEETKIKSPFEQPKKLPHKDPPEQSPLT